MQIIFGLGNPGREYRFTRHNFAFLFLDFVAKKRHLTWQKKARFQAEIAYDKKYKILLVKPQSYYNLVGDSLLSILNFYQASLQDVLVVCDDFYLPFGDFRWREKGSAGGNNGLKSIIARTHSDQFKRLRLGTGNDALRKRLGDIDFVLSRFTPTEKAGLAEVLNAAYRYCFYEKT